MLIKRTIAGAAPSSKEMKTRDQRDKPEDLY